MGSYPYINRASSHKTIKLLQDLQRIPGQLSERSINNAESEIKPHSKINIKETNNEIRGLLIKTDTTRREIQTSTYRLQITASQESF
jgi:hypothetical protein